jgi:hypothetical protein
MQQLTRRCIEKISNQCENALSTLVPTPFTRPLNWVIWDLSRPAHIGALSQWPCSETAIKQMAKVNINSLYLVNLIKKNCKGTALLWSCNHLGTSGRRHLRIHVFLIKAIIRKIVRRHISSEAYPDLYRCNISHEDFADHSSYYFSPLKRGYS